MSIKRWKPNCYTIGVWCCERMAFCRWQGYELSFGLAWGRVEDCSPTWREWHDRECGGKLIQLVEQNREE